MKSFTPDADWLHWHQAPSKPRFSLPESAVDAHCHVFGPGEQFPFAETRKYTPCDASKQQLWQLRDFLGVSRNVIVQATCHGNDNSALVDALVSADGMARGIASVSVDISDSELEALHSSGVRGVRFNFVRRLVDALPFDDLTRVAARINELGWHIVIYFESQELAELYHFFESLPTIIIVDHMGRPDIAKGVEDPQFELFLSLLRGNENFWSKVSCPERLSKTGPHGYQDVIPFAKKVIDEFPDRVLWGTDWPHPNMKSHMPDDGKLVDFIPKVATTVELRRKLLVENPMRLYFSDEENN
jgi:2-pyrone-4,6-dicarboxylate lactonase